MSFHHSIGISIEIYCYLAFGRFRDQPEVINVTLIIDCYEAREVFIMNDPLCAFRQQLDA